MNMGLNTTFCLNKFIGIPKLKIFDTKIPNNQQPCEYLTRRLLTLGANRQHFWQTY